MKKIRLNAILVRKGKTTQKTQPPAPKKDVSVSQYENTESSDRYEEIRKRAEERKEAAQRKSQVRIPANHVHNHVIGMFNTFSRVHVR
jgi:predicted Holliday junction resolvase-like endonuclease